MRAAPLLRSALPAIALSVLHAACAGRAALAAPPPPPPAPGAKPAAPAVTLAVADKAGYEALLKKHRGKVVVVDFWATWCVPCMKDFPKTVAWTKSLPADQVVIVTVCLDDAENKARSLAFLEKQKAVTVNLLAANGADDKSFLEFDIDGGALPHFKVYDRSGTLVRKFPSDDPCKTYTHEDVEATVKKLLAPR